MKPNPKIAAAVAAILGAPSTMLVYAAPAETAAPESAGLQEVVVTAQRRSENLQDVPITVQALSGEQLQQLSVVGFNDLLKYTPNVTFSGNGPGTGNIFIRGLGAVGSGNQSQSTTAPFPNVALYLDDQAMQFPARNNDVYLVDMERVEVLEGPQGTLFGGGAQAGAIRYITNKPRLGRTEGAGNASYGTTAGGDPNYNANLTLNLPFGDSVAMRAVVFTEHQGGYISNIPDTISVPPVTVASPGGQPPLRPGSPPAANAGVSGSNLNTLQYGGARLSALFKFNDDWDLLLQQNYQRFEADGYFYEYPIDPNGQPLANHQITAFTPAFSKDDYSSTAWTLSGRFAGLNAVYTGSYMVRHIDGQQDYSNYMRSGHGSYYACSGKGAGYYYFRSAKPTTCYAPVGSWRDQVRNTHVSHEFRLSTNEEYRLRGLVGAFYEKFSIYDNMNFNYMPIPQCSAANLAISAAGGPDCVTTVGPIAGYFSGTPGYRDNTNTAFGEDVLRGYRQTAFFGSFDLDLIPKVLTLTAGTRHYKYDEFEHGSEYYSATSTVLNVPNDTCTHCGFGINLNKSESGFKSRANLTWHVTPDVLAYYTWSQGFRPGGFNRTHTSMDGSQIFLKGVAPYCGSINGLQNAADPACLPGGALWNAAKGKPYNTSQFLKPSGYLSDNLVNNEIGFKSEFLEHRVLFNASLYQMDWKGVQLPLFDPVHLGNTTFDVNGPTYRVRGVEIQLVARVAEGLTVQGSSSWNASEQTNAPCLTSNRVDPHNPTPIGQCIGVIRENQFTNPYGKLGTRAPFSPALEFNLRARYDWEINGYHPFASVGATHIGAMSNEPASFPSESDPATASLCIDPPTTTYCRYQIPGYTTYDASIGTTKDNWTVQLSAVNLTNSDAVTNVSSGQFIKSQIPIRPRVLTFAMGYKF
ncbi:MAG: TonB-dependent receptor [Steroidobacteraceae bacterium]